MTMPVFNDERESWQHESGLIIVSRHAFARDYFDPKPGAHVLFGGPSTAGKTSLAFDLLEYQANPTFPAFIAVSKPTDPVTRQRGTDLHYRFVTDWPPPKKLGEMFGGQKPSGYVIWPPFGDMATDMDRCAEATGKLLMDRYAAGARKGNTGGMLVMDDTMVKAKLMGQDGHMVTILAMGAAMKLGLWVFIQKPTDSGRTTTWSYEMCRHLFLSKGGDKQMMRRYIEIIGSNGRIAERVLPTLTAHQFLYCQRDDDYMCIVDAKPAGGYR